MTNEFKAAGYEVRITQGKVYLREEGSPDGNAYIYHGELLWKKEEESMSDFIRRLTDEI